MSSLRALFLLAIAGLAMGLTGPCTQPAAAPAVAPPPPDPELSLAINGVAASRVVRGSAILVDLLAVHPGWPNAVTGSIPLAGSPTWASLARLEITDANGVNVAWPVTFRPASPAALALDASSFGTLEGVVAPADSLGLSAGVYTAQAVLDARGAPSGGYQGIVRSPRVRVVVVDPISQPTPTEEEALAVLSAGHRLRMGDVAQATAELEAFVANAPDSIPALTLLSDLDRAAGRSASALARIDLALGAWRAVAPPFDAGVSDPPVFLLARQRELRNAALRAASNNASPTLSARISAKVPSTQPDTLEVDVTFTNTGAGTALDAQVGAVKARVLQGVGNVALDAALGPALPIALGTLAPGASATVRLNVHVDPGVVRFALTEDGTTGSSFGTFGFSLTQATYK